MAEAAEVIPYDDGDGEENVSSDGTMDSILGMIQAVKLAMDPPEWMRQHMLIQRGKAQWDDFSFEDRTCNGWLWPYLLQIDNMPRMLRKDVPDEMIMDRGKTPVYLRGGSGRWSWWMDAHLRRRLPDSPIPQISFFGSHDHETMRMLEKCLDVDWNYRLDHFLEWILWGFGEGKERPRISEKTNEKWYRMFNLGLMIVNPCDYWGYLYSETKGRGSWNRSGFYPTPHHVCNMMARMQMADMEREDPGFDKRLISVLEPCAGTGRMLMEASNYSVNMHAMDIDPICIAATKVNGYLYIPWLVRPAPWVAELREAGNKVEKIKEPAEETIEETIARVIKEVDPEYQIEFEATQNSGVHRFKIKSGPAKSTKFKVQDLTTPEEFRAKYKRAIEKAVKSKSKKHKQLLLWEA